MNFYVDAYFSGLWVHDNPQDLICYNSRTGFVVTFPNCTILWVSKIKRDIYLSILNSDYVVFYHSVRELLPLKILIKEVVDNLGINR